DPASGSGQKRKVAAIIGPYMWTLKSARGAPTLKFKLLNPACRSYPRRSVCGDPTDGRQPMSMAATDRGGQNLDRPPWGSCEHGGTAHLLSASLMKPRPRSKRLPGLIGGNGDRRL